MGLEVPSESLGYAHLTLLALLILLALLQPQRAILLLLLGGGIIVTLGLPALWVGPLWAEAPGARRLAWGFYLSFASSLGIPFALGAIAVTLLARRARVPSVRQRIMWPLVAYVGGLVLSAPVSFNYALAYPLLR